MVSLCSWWEDFNADPDVIPCLAKGISSGCFVSLILLVSLSWMSVLVPGVILQLRVPILWLLLLLVG